MWLSYTPTWALAPLPSATLSTTPKLHSTSPRRTAVRPVLPVGQCASAFGWRGVVAPPPPLLPLPVSRTLPLTWHNQRPHPLQPCSGHAQRVLHRRDGPANARHHAQECSSGGCLPQRRPGLAVRVMAAAPAPVLARACVSTPCQAPLRAASSCLQPVPPHVTYLSCSAHAADLWYRLHLPPHTGHLPAWTAVTKAAAAARAMPGSGRAWRAWSGRSWTCRAAGGMSCRTRRRNGMCRQQQRGAGGERCGGGRHGHGIMGDAALIWFADILHASAHLQGVTAPHFNSTGQWQALLFTPQAQGLHLAVSGIR